VLFSLNVFMRWSKTAAKVDVFREKRKVKPYFRAVFTRVAASCHKWLFVTAVFLAGMQACTPPEGRSYHAEAEPPQPVHPLVKGPIECLFIEYGLVAIQDHPSLLTSLAYTDTANFMGMDMYGRLNTLYLHPEVALKLTRVLDSLAVVHPDLRLVVYDGARPHHIQQLMWDSLDLPLHLKTRFLAHPDKVSLHNYGAAVDVTLASANGIVLDMGTDYDDPSLLSYPSLHYDHYKQGLLSRTQLDNRELLNELMYAAGFTRIDSEWWHFNACTRAYAAAHYTLIP
jgi:D-alanyl-D-alanine dipeptidase